MRSDHSTVCLKWIAAKTSTALNSKWGLGRHGNGKREIYIQLTYLQFIYFLDLVLTKIKIFVLFEWNKLNLKFVI